MTNPVGSFIWYELMTVDPVAAARFYGSVVGWKIAERAAPEAGGRDYRVIERHDGGNAGGVLRINEDMARHGATSIWLGYLRVTDVDAAVSSIEADGGKALLRGADLPVGRIAMVADPMGTLFYVMNPIPPADKSEQRSDVFDPMAVQHVRWNELASPDLARAQAFYAKHFGFSFREVMPMGQHGDYCFFEVGAQRLGAMMQQPEPRSDAPWTFYFGVNSVVAATRAIETGGGRIMRPMHEVPGGDWITVGVDPQGAVFGVVGPR